MGGGGGGVPETPPFPLGPHKKKKINMIYISPVLSTFRAKSAQNRGNVNHVHNVDPSFLKKWLKLGKC